MSGDPVPPSETLVEYLRREAPIEFARLRSIARVMDTRGTGPTRALDPVDDAHAAWLRAAFGSFNATDTVDSAA